MKLYFKKSGMLTQVQDMGREGCQEYGIPIGGAMDTEAMEYANLLVNNELDSPVLEITLLGPTILFSGEGSIAITGANLSPQLNGEPIALNTIVAINDSDELRFGRCVTGCRSYLAVGGDWQVTRWLGSVSPVIGFPGLTPNSTIKKEDSISILTNSSNGSIELIQITPNISSDIEVMPGPEFHSFTAEQIAFLFNVEFTITVDSNRMGYRLAEKLPNYSNPKEILSSGIVPGVIQISNDGHPIIMMRDAQTIGGYPRILNVIADSINILAQKKPGDVIQFKMVR